jgi:exosortase D (VPLPA-CTERM-specific)
MQIKSISRSNWLLGISFTVLIGAFCLQYYIDLIDLVKRWNSQDFSYSYLVPFVFLYLVYINRQSLKNVELRPSLLGVAVLFFSGVLYLMGKLGSVATLTHIAIWVSIIGLIVLILGTKMAKALAFPLLILAFIVPLPPFLNRLFTFKLKLITSDFSVRMMQAVGFSVYREGNIIDLGLTQLQVVDACSGMRYVYPMLLMGLLVGYIFHRKWWKRVLLVLATIPISVIANALRISITGFLAAKVSQQVADTFFHGFSGWLIFMVSLFFLFLLSLLLKLQKVRTKDEQISKIEATNPGSSHFDLRDIQKSYLWVASVLFLLFWGLNGVLVTAQIEPSRKTLDEFPTTIGEWKGRRSYIRPEILERLWADDYVKIEFTSALTGDVLFFFVPYYEYQEIRHTAHSPVSCLVGGGFAPRSRKMIERNFPKPFGKVGIRQMVFEKSNQLVLSNYWFQQRGRIIVSEYWNKWYLFWDSLTRRRTDGALVRLEIPLQRDQDLKSAQAVMDGFTQEVMKILPDYVPM